MSGLTSPTGPAAVACTGGPTSPSGISLWRILNVLDGVAVCASLPVLVLVVRLAIRAGEPTGHPATLVLAGLLVVATSAGLHLGVARFLRRHSWPLWAQWTAQVLPTLTILVGLFAVGLSGWSLLIVAAAAAVLWQLWQPSFWPQLQAESQLETPAHPFEADTPFQSIVDERCGEFSEVDGGDGADTGDGADAEHGLWQRIERRIVDGQEIITMWQRVEIPAFARHLTLHFPFWPALASIPDVDGEASAVGDADGLDASVKIEQVELHGCRIRVELSEADERPQSVDVEVAAVS